MATMIQTSHLLILGALFVAWSGGIFAVVEALKSTARMLGFEAHRVWVRALPVLPWLVGAATGAEGAVRWALVLAGIEPPEEVPWAAVGAFLGVGAGAVSGQAFKVWRQAVRSLDARLE